jgi:hypothetical protein
MSTRWLTVLLELCCLEEEEKVFHPPILRVQAPYIGRSLVIECPVAAALAWVPLLSILLPGRMLLYKVPLSPRPAYPGYMPPTCLRSFRGEEVCLVRLVKAVRG